MAVTQVKRSVHKKQSAHTKKKAYRRVFHFPQTRGKMIEDVEFSTSTDYHNISINFQDKTALNFSIETGFTLEPDYSDWKSGNQRVIRTWSPIRAQG